MTQAFPTTIVFSVLPHYRVRSFINVLKEPSLQMIDEQLTKKDFKKYTEQLYLPILEFVEQNQLSVNLIISGQFLEYSLQLCPKIIEKMQILVEKNLVKLVANCYHSEAMTSVYNVYWWIESVQKTVVLLEKTFDLTIKRAYLPQLFRSLKLEQLTNNSQINTFLLRQKGKKHLSFSMKLSELRRFHGESAFWISEENDKNCHFYYVPDLNFFKVNGNIFQPDLQQAMRTFCMAVGYQTNTYTIRQQTRRQRQSHQIPRLSEKSSLALYGTLEKSIARLWEYGSTLVASEYKNNPDEFNSRLFQEYSSLQNTDFFFFLQKSHYLLGGSEHFTSPYEAFVNMQSSVKQVEILIRNKNHLFPPTPANS